MPFRTIALLLCAASLALDAGAQTRTFCNPLNLPYHFQSPGPARREAADPVIVLFRGKYWLFASKQVGYWWSDDLLDWHQVKPTGLPLEEYAPSVTVVNGRLYYTSGGTKGTFVTDDLLVGHWVNLNPYKPGASDPEVFQDTDGRVYLYDGCSDTASLRVTELDPKTMLPLGEPKGVIAADTLHHGWENEPSAPGRAPWIEGSWVNKIGGHYYWQYSAPGTQYSSYADGVYVSDSAEGPYRYQPYSPFSFKPTGFITGAGHSATFTDKTGEYWHISTGTISVRHMFERRLVLFPAAVLDDGQLVVNTYLGDYPQWAPGTAKDHLLGNEPPWMLLSYHKPATASSTLGPAFDVRNAVDENIRTWWSAAVATPGEWVQVDLGKVCRVNAIQVNFADQGARLQDSAASEAASADLAPGDGYAYEVSASRDGKTWKTLIDRKDDIRDTPHDYVQLKEPAEVRYIRITGFHSPGGSLFSLYDLRVFGSAPGVIPPPVRGFSVQMDAADPRCAHVRWAPDPGADFFIVRYGTAPDRLYGNYQVYDAHELDIHALNAGVRYYFTIDAVNGTGIRKGGAPQ